ncbi:MAG TPA: adenylate cyclase regulatory domain-containing protein [Pseudonocardiaceae bacterium]
MTATTTDWDAEGLTDGLDATARAARVALLEELGRQGVPVEEMRRAVAEDRLVLLPVERVLAGEPRYGRAELAAAAGVDEDLAAELLAALGLSLPEAHVVAYTDQDLDLARRLRAVLDAGLERGAVVELARVLGLGMARYAEAVRTTIGRGFIRAGDSEYDVATRYAAVARALLPDNAAMLRHAFTRHLLEVVRSDVITAAELERGEVTGRTVQAVAFADLVGFTWLGEQLESEELGAVGARLGALAAAGVEPPCRLVKTIGDAVMLVSPDTGALVRSVLRLVEAADADEELPSLRAGVALGPAVARFGDYYGSAVNLASRVTGRARPGSVLVTDAVRDELAGDPALTWTRTGPHRLKGVDGRRTLWRVRPR